MSIIPSANELWSPLENAVIPERAKVTDSMVRAKLSQEQQKKVDAEFWTALDARNLEDLKKALEDGARLEMRRQGGPAISALYVAFEKNYTEIALFLMEKGANIHVLGTRKQSLPALAIEHDSPELMEALVTHGLDVTKSVRWYHSPKFLPELFHNAPKVIRWWLDKGFALSFKEPSHQTEGALPLWISTWVPKALYHKELFHPIMDKLNHEAPPGWDKKKEWRDELTTHWLYAFHSDNAELIRFMAKEKWTPNPTVSLDRWITVKVNAMNAASLPLNSPHALHSAAGHHQKVTEDVSIFWKAVAARAVRCMELLLSSPAMKDWVEKDLAERKDFLLEMIPPHVPTLEKLLPLGLDLTMSNSKGTLFHHHNYDITKGLAEWLVKKSPEALLMKNAEGKTIFDSYHRGGISVEWAEKLLLQRSVEKAPRKSKKAPLKIKARL